MRSRVDVLVENLIYLFINPHSATVIDTVTVVNRCQPCSCSCCSNCSAVALFSCCTGVPDVQRVLVKDGHARCLSGSSSESKVRRELCNHVR